MMQKDEFLVRLKEIDPPDLGGFMEGNAGGSSIRKIEGQILYKICKIFRPKRIIETGTHSGCSTNYLLQYAQEEGATVFSFDLLRAGGSIIKSLRKNLILHTIQSSIWRRKIGPEDVARLRGLVLQYAAEGVDLFFHDSDHRYENVKWEYDHITPYMKKGSPVILHDVLNKTPEHETHIVFNEVIQCRWKHLFKTPNGLGIIVL